MNVYTGHLMSMTNKDEDFKKNALRSALSTLTIVFYLKYDKIKLKTWFPRTKN